MGTKPTAQQCPMRVLPARRACVGAAMKNCSLLAAAVLLKIKVFSCRFWMFSVGCAGFLPCLSVPRGAVGVLRGRMSPGDCQALLGHPPAEGLGVAWPIPPWMSGFVLPLPGFSSRPLSFSSLLRLQTPIVFRSSPAAAGRAVTAVGPSACPCSDVSLGSLTNGLENVTEMQKSII